jgi:hypothetical protein
VLQGAGGLAVAAVAGVGWRAFDQGVVGGGPAAALEPWRSWRGEPAEGPLALVHAAILAASPHNTQPWIFAVAPDRIDLYADESRNLGTIDGLRRELHLGLGCALENLLLAAAPHGLVATPTLHPATDPDEPVATIELAAAGRSASAHYDAIPNRHTNRGPYRSAVALGGDLVSELERLAADLAGTRLVWWSSAADRAAFASATVAASRAILADAEQSRDSARWLRFDADAIERHRDGLGVDALGLSPLVAGAIKMLPTPSQRRIDESWLRATEQVHTATAPLFGAIVVGDDRDRRQRLRAGQLWQRIQLSATLAGVVGQPLSQLVERRDREIELGLPPVFGDTLRSLAGSSDWSVVLPFRLGYPERSAPASPRRSVASVLKG